MQLPVQPNFCPRDSCITHTPAFLRQDIMVTRIGQERRSGSRPSWCVQRELVLSSTLTLIMCRIGQLNGSKLFWLAAHMQAAFQSPALKSRVARMFVVQESKIKVDGRCCTYHADLEALTTSLGVLSTMKES